MLRVLKKLWRAIMPEPDEFKSSPVAGALCMLAVQQWARNYEEHITLAAAAFDACSNGFLNVEVPEFARQELINTIKSAAKRNGK
jgi:ABC-type branched-subunit amino acid transport system permease subunit